MELAVFPANTRQQHPFDETDIAVLRLVRVLEVRAGPRAVVAPQRLHSEVVPAVGLVANERLGRTSIRQPIEQPQRLCVAPVVEDLSGFPPILLDGLLLLVFLARDLQRLARRDVRRIELQDLVVPDDGGGVVARVEGRVRPLPGGGDLLCVVARGSGRCRLLGVLDESSERGE